REQAPSAAPRRLAAQLGLPASALLGLDAAGSMAQPAGSAAVPAASKAVGAGAGWLHGVAGKLVLAGVLGALGGGALVGMMSSRDPSTPASKSTSVSVSPSPSPSSAPPASAVVGGAVPDGVLDREVAELARVRGELQAGKAEQALAGLASFEREHPASVLMQEARALRIEALLAKRELDAAQDEGARFLRAFPDSPHRVRVQALLRASHSLR
ncbi:MAG TPA: hypothetical protein VFZ61_14055, partial [Polyangiales bacterium]